MELLNSISPEFKVLVSRLSALCPLLLSLIAATDTTGASCLMDLFGKLEAIVPMQPFRIR
jgi:hypothetical protein